MLRIKDAQTLILKHVKPLPSIEMHLDSVLHFVLSENVYSPIDLPPFSRAKVSGFAISRENLNKYDEFLVTDNLKQGEWHFTKIRNQHIVRVSKGSIIPPGADAVVPLEEVKFISEQVIKIPKKKYSLYENILLRGSEVRLGEKVLQKHTFITPAIAGLLASLGVEKVEVFGSPSVTVLITGNELQPPGTLLETAKIYDSNGYFLRSALQELFLKTIRSVWVRDDKDLLAEELNKALMFSDFIIITGGIGYNEEDDFVSQTLELLGFEPIFTEINAYTYPKKILFGKLDRAFVMALSGEPSALFVNFYELILPVIKALKGSASCLLTPLFLPTEVPVNNPFERDLLLPVYIHRDKIIKVFERENPMNSGNINALAFVPKEVSSVKKGETLEVHLLSELCC